MAWLYALAISLAIVAWTAFAAVVRAGQKSRTQISLSEPFG